MQPFIYADDISRVDLGDGLWVDIKRKLSYGDQQKLLASYTKIDKFSDAEKVNDIKINFEEGNLAMLLIYIVDWNFPDRDGSIAVINKANISMLDPEIAKTIMEEVNKQLPLAQAVVGTEKKKLK